MATVYSYALGQRVKIIDDELVFRASHTSTSAPIEFNQTSVTNTALSLLTELGFEQDDLDAATYMEITVTGANIRYRTDGQDPTTTTGHQLAAGNGRPFEGHDRFVNFACIAEAGTALVSITLYS